MAINNLTTTNYVQDTEDLAAYKLQNPAKEVTPPVEKATEPKSDSFNTLNSNAVSSNTNNKQYIKSNLQIDIKDNDGFANMGKNDINAKLSGDVNVTKDFVFDQLAKMKDSPEKKFNPPKFDADRKQYIISGKAINAILGMINVNFEIRLGAVNGNLAFQVDSGITRGSIYGDLEKMLKEAGIESYRQDKLLFIKPTYTQSIDIPVSKDKTHPAKVEKLETNANNTKINIDKFGNINVKLKDVPMLASTDAGTANTKIAKPDSASVKFDFALGSDMKPSGSFSNGTINASLSQDQMEKYAGKGNLDFMKETFGTAFSVSLSNLNGNFKMDDKGVALSAKTSTKIEAKDSEAKITTDVKVDFDGKSPVIEARDLKANLKDNQKVNAEDVIYDGRKEGINVTAKGLDASIHTKGINADLQGSGHVSKQGDNLTADFTGDTKGSVKKDDIDATFNTSGKHNISTGKNKLDVKVENANANVHTKEINAEIHGSGNVTKQGDDISADFKGNTKGDVKKDGIDATFETSGEHKIAVGKTKIDINVDLAIANANYDTTVKPAKSDAKPEDITAKKPQINIDVKSIDVTGKIKSAITNVDATIKEGGVKVSVGNDIKISSDAKISGKAVGERINGTVDVKGTEIKVGQDGNINVQANNTKADGSFKTPNKIKVEGKVNGDININIDKDATVEVNSKNGNFDAKFNKADRIKVDGKGKEAYFKIDKNEDIKVSLGHVEAKTDIKANNIKINAQTKGENVTVEAKGDNVSVVTKNTKSVADVKVKEIVTTHGTVGDVSVKVNSTKKGDDVKVDVKNADMNAKIKNKNGNVNVDVDTKANVNIHVKEDGNVSIASKNAKETKANFKLGKKIDVDAQGKNFNVDIIDDDVNIKLKESNFQGKVNPNQKINVAVNTETKSDISVKVSSKKEYDDIKVSTKSALKGNVSINDKLNSDFSNKDGFDLSIRDDDKGTNVKTNLNQLNLSGNFATEGAKLGIDGKGDFNLNIMDGDNISDVKIGYNGKVNGNADMGNMANGKYDVNGNVNVDINGDDINIDADGSVGADVKSDKFGVGANASVNGNKDNKIKVNINTKDDTKVSANINQGGLIDLTDIDKLKLGKSDPVITDLMNKLKSKSAKISYQNLDIQNNAEKVSVNVQAKDVKTDMGSFSAGLLLKKNGPTVQIEKGLLVLQPNEKLFELIKSEVSKKYNINITGTPELKDGAISLKGEIKSKTGITQIADFNIKVTVVDNQLVLDMDKAKVLKVVGTNTVNMFVDKLLNRTDIDHVRLDKKNITINLADIVKDLTLTEGINFTGLKLEGDKIKIGFNYNSIDQDIASFSKKKDVKGLSDYINKTGYQNLSGEALSTAYSTYAHAGDVNKSSQLLADLVKTYGSSDTNKAEIERGINWIAKNQGMKKKSIEDDITMNFTKLINLKSAEGQKLIKALPTEVVVNLANNLDRTISQGGGLSMISGDERKTANELRRLKGIPENKSII